MNLVISPLEVAMKTNIAINKEDVDMLPVFKLPSQVTPICNIPCQVLFEI